MTIIKNQTQLLTVGAEGEEAAKAAGHAVAFTRVTIGDANGVLPTLDLARTALDNHVKEGAVLSHTVDVENADQRKLVLRIGPDANYEARELLLFATANGVEFPHSYIRLGAAYPVRLPENDGIQITIETYVKVSSETVFNINVKPATDYISRPEFEGHNHDTAYPSKNEFNNHGHTAEQVGAYSKSQSDANSNSIDVDELMDAVTVGGRLHVFINTVDLQIPNGVGTWFDFIVDESLELSSANKCRLLAPPGKKIIMNKTPYNSIELQVQNIRHTVRKNSNGDYKI